MKRAGGTMLSLVLGMRTVLATGAEPSETASSCEAKESAWGYGNSYAPREGGWDEPSDHIKLNRQHLSDGICTIPRRRACRQGSEETTGGLDNNNCLTKKEFRKRFKGKKAVLISGLMDSWSARENWTKGNLQNSSSPGFGNMELASPGSGDEVNFFQGEGVAEKMSLSDVISDKNLFAFGRFRDPSGGFPDVLVQDCVPQFDWAPELCPGQDTFSVSGGETIRPGSPGSWWQLSVGSDGQGLGWHQHGAAWQGLVHGLKQWYLFEPGRATTETRGNPFLNGSMWEKISLPALSAEKRPLMCLQRPGELLYVPSAWAHLTVNVGDAVAIGVNSMLHTPRDGKLLRKAARLGDPEAATHFGDMYGDANMLYQGARLYHPGAVLEIISWVDFLGMHRDGRLKQLQDIPDSYPSAKIQKQMTAHEVGVLTEEIVDVVDALAKTVETSSLVTSRMKGILKAKATALIDRLKLPPLALKDVRHNAKKRKRKKNSSKKPKSIRHIPVEEYFSLSKMFRREFFDEDEDEDDN